MMVWVGKNNIVSVQLETTTMEEEREYNHQPSKMRIKLGFYLGLQFFIFIFFFNSIQLVEGSIHDYKNEKFIPQSNAFFFHGGSEGLYASKVEDQSSSSDKGYKGRSFIRFDSITFTRTKESAEKQNEWQQFTGSVEAIIVEVKDRERIGGTYLKTDAICCNQTLANEGHCKIGEVIMQTNPENREWPHRIKIFFAGKSETATMSLQSVDIKKTGMYYLYFMYCDPTLKGTTISGRTLWKNPDGYLPGKMTPLMKFYGFMSLAYLLLGLGWLLRFVHYWKDIIQLHYHITVVIALGMLEMALWYFDYSNLNATGVRPMGVTMWAVTFTAVKKTLSRLLLLVVSMGYGVVKPTLGAITSKVLLFGTVYFLGSEALELYEHLGNINDFSGKTKLVLVLPVVFLDTCFILWIFSSLSNTLEKLQMRRSLAKLELYRKFTNSLAIFVVLSIAWIGYELYFNATDPLGELWRIAWIIPAFWALLAYSLLVVICILWAPSRNPTRYAYLEESGDDFDEEGVSLTSSGVKVAADMSSMVERKDRKVPSAPDHMFVGVREEPEEDKRE